MNHKNILESSLESEWASSFSKDSIDGVVYRKKRKFNAYKKAKLKDRIETRITTNEGNETMKLNKKLLKKMILKEIMTWGDDESFDVNPQNEHISNAINLINNTQKEVASALAKKGGIGNTDSQTMFLIKAQRSLKETLFYLLDAEKNNGEFFSER